MEGNISLCQTVKRFRKLIEQWTDLALELSQTKSRLGLHSDGS